MTPSGRRRLLIVAVTVVPLFLVGQQSTTTGQSGSSNPDAFCSSWDEARSALLDENIQNRDEGLQSFDDAAERQLEIIDSTDALVPPEIRAEWDAAAGFRRAVFELLFTVDPARVLPIHLELAFGDADPDSLEADAMAAVAAIDEWTVTGCGDFCDRWPAIERAIRLDDENFFFQEPQRLAERDRTDMRLLASIDPIVPDELRTAWDEMLARRSIVSDALAANPGDPWQYFEGRDTNVDEYLDELARLVEPITAWAVANCDAAATTSDAPGTLTVRLQLTDDALGKTAFVAVVEPGAPITGLDSNAGLSGGNCPAVLEPSSRGPIEVPVLEPQGSSRLCEFLAGEGGGEQVRLDAGTYDVVVSTVTGLNDADLDRFVPPPDRCVRFPVVIGGDTAIDAPALEPCELGPIAGDPADGANLWAPVVDPGEPGAGTLTVILPDAINPTTKPDVDAATQEASGTVLAIALPSGTTLDEVGRREVWPPGAVCAETVTREFAAARGDQGEATRARELPLLPLSATGVPPHCLSAWANESDDRLGHGAYVPVTLAQGVYDLYLEANPEEIGAIGAQIAERRCYRQEVTIDGDVEVTVPPATDWEVCP